MQRAPAPAAVMRKARRENFPVASRVLPREVRADLLAIYGFARLVDDLGDEDGGVRDREPAGDGHGAGGEGEAGRRLAALDWLEGELGRVYDGSPEHPLMRALVRAVRRHDIPPEPFRKLIEANRQDQRVARYQTFGDLVGYCRLSANPVGHLVLYVFGRATTQRMALSDCICTGLQLVEHWQDVAEDLRRGRIYLPQEDLRAFGVSEDDLRGSRPSPAFRRLMAFEAHRARRLLEAGLPLVRMLPPRPAVAVAAFAGGGRSALHAIERAGFDVLGRHPRPSAGRKLTAFLGAVAGGLVLRER